MDAKRTEWVFENQMEELRRNMLDEEKHRMGFGNQMGELRTEYDGWEWVFGNQLVELPTVYDGWETDRTSSPEGNHRDLQDLCRSVTWGVTTAIVISSRIHFVWESEEIGAVKMENLSFFCGFLELGIGRELRWISKVCFVSGNEDGGALLLFCGISCKRRSSGGGIGIRKEFTISVFQSLNGRLVRSLFF